MHKLPVTPAEIDAWQAEMAAHEAALRQSVSGLMPELQLDCLLTAYISAAHQHGKQAECAQALVQIGGRMMFQLGLQPIAKCAVPASSQAMQHPTPPTVQ